MKMSDKNKNNNVKKEKGLMEGGSGTTNTNGNKESFILYPKSLAKYSDVISENDLFIQTLEKFHLAMKTKYMIPIIGGKDLDLHKLFKEVTTRGGIDKVVGDRRWKEVTASFTFPSTATNASFILRKYYYSLLYHYEQLYYFGSQGFYDTTDNMPSPLAQCIPERSQEGTIDSPTMHHKRKIRDEPPLPALPVTGVIDGKFEHGYFISVKIGSHTLRGTLYYCMDDAPSQPIILPQSVTFNSSPAFTAGPSNPRVGSQYASGSGSAAFGGRRLRRRRKKRPSTMDPNHPKPNRSGYNFFFAEQHAQLKPLHPGKDRDISRMIGERWTSLTEAEKNVYQEKGRVDKQRYQSELALYRKKQKTDPGHVISDAVPINQRPASGSDFTIEGVDIKVVEGDLVLANNNDNHNSDTDDTDGSQDGDKNQDLDLDDDTGSESDTSLDAKTLAAMESQSTGDAVQPRQTVPDGFELRKREVVVPVVEVESMEGGEKTSEGGKVEDSSKSMEGGLKTSEGYNTLVEVEVKTNEDLNDLVEGDVKAGEGSNNPVEGVVKMGEASNDPVGGDGKTGEEFDGPVQGTVKMVEDGVKSGQDAIISVEGDVKMVETLNSMVSSDVKTCEYFNSPTGGDVTMGTEVGGPKDVKMFDVG